MYQTKKLRRNRNYSFRSLLVLIAIPALSSTSSAHEYGKGNIEVDHPWARPTIVTTAPAAAYLIIRNNGDKDDTLLAAYVPDTIAQATELHQSSREDDIASMRMELGGVTVGAGQSLNFVPGGRHIMLLGLQDALEEGERFPMTLVFEEAGIIEVVVYVEQPEHGTAVEHDHAGH